MLPREGGRVVLQLPQVPDCDEVLWESDHQSCNCLFCGSDTRCVVLQYRILLDRKRKGANESLRGHPPFRSEACENIV